MIRARIVVALGIGALAAGTACVAARSSGGAGSGGAGDATASRVPSSDDVLTRDEILASNVSNAYDAIARLRPRFLAYRGSATARYPSGVAPVVYFGEDRLGALAELRSVDLVHVAEIRYIGPIDAQTRYGSGYTGGVILIVTRKEP